MLREPLTNFFCDHSDFDKLISDFKSGLPDMEIGGTGSELYDMIGRGS